MKANGSRKILFVTSSFYKPGHPNSTGGTISNYLMCDTLAKLCELHILLVGSDAAEMDDLAGAYISREPSPRWTGLQLMLRWNKYVQEATRSAISKYGPFDAVIAVSDSVPALVTNVVGGAATGVVVKAFENFGLQPDSVTSSSRVSLAKQAAVRQFVDGHVIQKATIVATNSNFMSQAVQKRFGCKECQLHVIVEQCGVGPNPNLVAPENVVGFVSRNADKNPQFVVSMADRTPDIKYLVYGRKPIFDYQPPNLVWKGWSNNRQEMLSSAKVWVMPSAWAEPFGRVAIEAQAANRAAVVHAVGGLPETIYDPAYAISGLDSATWEAVIRKALSMSTDELKRNGKKIRDTYSSAAHDRSIRVLVEKLVAI